jgi:hypothetical protein
MPLDDGHMTKHVVAVISEEERRNCFVDGPLIAELNYKTCLLILS